MKAILTLSVFFCLMSAGAQRITPEQYVDMYKDAAIAQMKRLGVPASIILAQGILETESGNSDLVKRSNNHFGIKCKSSWKGESVRHTDDAPNECFRKYPSAMESYQDHSDYLYNSPRYAALFKLASTDYKGWAYGLKKAGYATNPRYPQILISNIEKYNLQQYNEPDLRDRMTDITNAEITAASVVPVQTPTQNISQKPIESNPSPHVGESIVVEKETNVFKKLFSAKKNTAKQYFNNLRAVMAFKGTSLLAIATQNDIALSKLLEYNDLLHDGLLDVDQWIYLEKKHKEGSPVTHTSLQNETLHQASQFYAIQLDKLASYNQMNVDAILTKGQTIYLKPNIYREVLPTVAAQTTTATTKAPAAGTNVHEVQPKEGLYSIAKKYNVSIEEIKQWNQLISNDIKVGQQLIIAK
jgi:flagellum-specific peptidoglycan hydrolase FlgJ